MRSCYSKVSPLNQNNWCLIKRRNLHTHTHTHTQATIWTWRQRSGCYVCRSRNKIPRKPSEVKREAWYWFSLSEKQEPTLLTIFSHTSSLQNCEIMKFFFFSYPICSTFKMAIRKLIHHHTLYKYTFIMKII